jgi:DNA-3-methyladenine glycosylase II
MISNTGVAQSFPAAAAILAERDPVLRRLVTEAGPPHLGPPAESYFAALVRAIVYQQLAGAAAAAIFGRLTTALGGDVTPQRLLSLPDAALRSAGLSGRKAASLQDLATKVLDGTVTLDPAKLTVQPDDEMIARLSSVRGIGIWTAQMFLIFQLMRLDVWPTEDLGVRKGYGLAWGIPTPTAKQLQPLGDPLPTLPQRGQLVLLASQRALRWRGRQRPDPLTAGGLGVAPCHTAGGCFIRSHRNRGASAECRLLVRALLCAD